MAEPKWPTDEAVSAAYGERSDLAVKAYREKLREAMLVDPIIQAAIKLRGCKGYVIAAVQAVVDAVNEAGI